MAIQERKIQQGRPALFNRPSQRSIATPEVQPGRLAGLGKLVQDLGIVVPAIAESNQDRANAEALAIYNDAQLRSENKSQKERDDIIAEARNKVSTGEGQGFFDKLFVDSEKSVQIFDKTTSNSQALLDFGKTRAWLRENPDADEADLRKFTSDVFSKGSAKMVGISELAGKEYNDKATKFLEELHLAKTEDFIERRREKQRTEIITDTHASVNELAQQYLGVDDIILQTATTNPESLQWLAESYAEPARRKHLIDSMFELVDKARTNMVGSFSASKEEAGLAKLNMMFSLADKYTDSKMLDELVSYPGLDNGPSIEQIFPDKVQAMREKLNTIIESRRRSMVETSKMQASNYERESVSNAGAEFLAKQNKVLNGGATAEDIQDLNTFVHTKRMDLAEAWENRTVSADYFKSMDSMIKSWEFESRAKGFITRPDVVAQADKHLMDIRGITTVPEEVVQFFEAKAEHMSPKQAREMSKYMTDSDNFGTYKDRLKANDELRSLNMFKNGTATKHFSVIQSAITTEVKKYLTPDGIYAKSQGVDRAQIPVINLDLLTAEVQNKVNARRDELASVKSKSEYQDKYKQLIDSVWKEVAENKVSEIKMFEQSIPTTAEEAKKSRGGREIEDIGDIEDKSQRSVAITKTLDSFGSDTREWTPKQRKSFAEDILPQISELLRERQRAGEFKTASDLTSAVRIMVPNLPKEDLDTIQRDVLETLWQDQLEAQQELRAKSGPLMGNRDLSLDVPEGSIPETSIPLDRTLGITPLEPIQQ